MSLLFFSSLLWNFLKGRKVGGYFRPRSQTGRCGTSSSPYLTLHQRKVGLAAISPGIIYISWASSDILCVCIIIEWHRNQDQLSDQLREKVIAL